MEGLSAFGQGELWTCGTIAPQRSWLSMRTSIIQAVSMLLLITSLVSYADAAPSIDHIVKQREAAMDQMVEYTKKQIRAGNALPSDLRNAQIDVYTLHRDSAKTNQDRIQWQKQIVATEKENVSALDGSQTVVCESKY
jgi:hypothetical protein